MAFCGYSSPNDVQKIGECFVDGARMVAPLLLICAAGPSILLRWCKLRTPCHITHSRLWLRYTGHQLRWILVICAVILELLLITEGILMYTSSASETGHHAHITSLVTIPANIFSLCIYNMTEIHRLPHLLFILLLYWIPYSGGSVIKVGVLLQNGVGIDSMRLNLLLTLWAVTLALLILECYLLWKMRYLSGSPRLAASPEELPNLGYLHPHTCFLSRLTWHWMGPLLAYGYRNILQLADLGSLPQTEDVKNNFKAFFKVFQEEKESAERDQRSPSLWRCYWRAYWPMLLLGGCFKILADMLVFVGPLALDQMVQYVERSVTVHPNGTTVTDNYIIAEAGYITVYDFFSNGYSLAILVFIAALLQASFLQSHFYLSVRQGIRCKGALQAMVYHKTLRLSSYSLNDGDMTQGQVLNHMAVDPANVFMLLYLGHFIWSIPIQVLVTLILLYVQLGISAIVGSFLVLLLCPLQWFVGRQLGQLQSKKLKQADERLRQSNELLQGIKLLKLYGWENIFRDAVIQTRRKELRMLIKAALLRIFSIMICDLAPLCSCVVTYLAYPVIEGEIMSQGKAFSGLALFTILNVPLYVVTLVTNILAHARVSTVRLTKLFLCSESESSQLQYQKSQSDLTPGKWNGHITMATNDEKIPQNCLEMSELESPLVTAEKNDGYKSNARACLYDIPRVTITSDDLPDSATQDTLCDPDFLPDLTQIPSDHSNTIEDHPDKEPPVVEVTLPQICTVDIEDYAVRVEHGSFSWDGSEKNPFLKDINIHIPKGKLTMVIGSVGSGKTSLLSALLNEMTTVSGNITWQNDMTLAYLPQKAWLLNATLRENVLFGEDFDSARYQRAVQACCLEQDIEQLPAGELTEIGEKGINLSGGQKQRVSLARALYCNANVILLDDPLSALDVHVGGHISTEAVQRCLLDEGKTVILVTHQLYYLPQADKILGLDGGRVIFQGNWQQLKTKHPERLIQSPQQQAHPSDSDGAVEVPLTKVVSGQTSGHSLQHSSHLDTCTLSRVALSASALSLHEGFFDDSPTHYSALNTQLSTDGETDTTLTEKGRLIHSEERETGGVSWSVYLEYMKAASYTLTVLTTLWYVGRQAIRCACDFYLALWVEAASIDQRTANYTNTTVSSFVDGDLLNGDFLKGELLSQYLFLCVGFILFALAAIITLEASTLIAAKNVHQNMLMAVVAAPRRFFDTTPIGRIVNRLAADTYTIDEKLPVTLEAVYFCVLYVLAGIIVNSLSTPLFLIPVIIMFGIFLAVQRYYITSSRELQRLDSITKSPILAHFSQTLSGLSTIRAYRRQDQFRTQNWKMVEENNTAFLFLHTANVWMGIRLDYLGAVLVLMASVFSITSGVIGQASPGVVGLAIAYSVMVCSFINWTMRSFSEIEMWFNAVERVTHYAKTPSEPYHTVTDKVPAVSWPEKGEIKFEDVSLRYDVSLPTVVSGLTVHIKRGQKVGICGRTGSGKSSMMLSLFRMLDLCEGRILIDSHDISHVPLHTLRSRLSLIPQDPVLFSGTVRSNLDPEKLQDDVAIWQALQIAQLKAVILEQQQVLDTIVTEGGENFSSGQRQLFCLARAFLRDSRILIMDEATASIDLETDRIIQNVMKDAFADRTVITIAHRVSTIMDYDVILVLSDGRVIEHDTPQNLLSQGGVFASMVHNNK